MNKDARILLGLFFLIFLIAPILTDCKKTSLDADNQPAGVNGYVYSDSSSKPIGGVLIIGKRCDGMIDEWMGDCIGNSIEFDRTTTDTNGFFQLVYDPDFYVIYIMGYEVINYDYTARIYYVRPW